jgi:hypothetical protein
MRRLILWLVLGAVAAAGAERFTVVEASISDMRTAM